VDAHPADVAPDDLDLADVHAEAQLEAVLARNSPDRGRALDRAARAVERDEHPVAGGLHLPPAEAFSLRSHPFEVRREHVPPDRVADTRCRLCRALPLALRAFVKAG
jgi:hypothetical protein